MLASNFLRMYFFLGVIFCLSLNQESIAQKMERPPSTPIVRGQVTDKNASPIIGATIIVDGTTKGIVSDENGFFELDLSQFKNKSITLNIGYVGHETKSVDVKIKDLPKSLGQIKLKDGVLSFLPIS